MFFNTMNTNLIFYISILKILLTSDAPELNETVTAFDNYRKVVTKQFEVVNRALLDLCDERLERIGASVNELLEALR